MRDTKADAETEMKTRTFPVYTESFGSEMLRSIFVACQFFLYLARVRLEHYIHLKVFTMTYF